MQLTSIAIPPAEFAERRARLAAHLQEQGLAAAVLFDNYYILYYSGFAFVPTERPLAFILTADGEAALFVPRLELEHAQQKTGFARVYQYVEYPSDPHPMHALGERSPTWGSRAIRRRQPTATPGSSATAAPSERVDRQAGAIITAFVEDQMAIKSAAEVALIRESAKWGNLAHRLLQRYTVVATPRTPSACAPATKPRWRCSIRSAISTWRGAPMARAPRAGYRGRLAATAPSRTRCRTT